MAIYYCRFCDYNNQHIASYYCHLYTHIELDNKELFTEEELEKTTYYVVHRYEYSKQYYEKNKAKLIEYKKNNYEKTKQLTRKYKKLYKQNNPDKIRESNRNYTSRNKDKIKEQKKVYRQINKDKIKEQKKVYRQLNKDKIKEQKQIYRQTKNIQECYDINNIDENDILLEFEY
jgi:hypothetical protein